MYDDMGLVSAVNRLEREVANLKVFDVPRMAALGARVYNSAVQSIANTGVTALTFDVEVYDTDDLWDIAAPTKFTIQHDGYYMVGGGWAMSAASNVAARRMGIAVRVNGAIYYSGQDIHTIAATYSNVAICSGMIYLVPDDYVELTAYQGQAAAKNAEAATATTQNTFNGWIARIS